MMMFLRIQFLLCMGYILLSYCQELTLTPTLMFIPRGRTAFFNCMLHQAAHIGTEIGSKHVVWCKDHKEIAQYHCIKCDSGTSWNYTINHAGASDDGIYQCSLSRCSSTESSNAGLLHVIETGTLHLGSTISPTKPPNAESSSITEPIIVHTNEPSTLREVANNSFVTESMITSKSSRSTNSAETALLYTTERSTSRKLAGTTTRNCDHHEQEKEQSSDCIPNIKNIKLSVTSLAEGNISKSEVKQKLDSTLNALQAFSQTNEHTPADLDSSLDVLDKIIDFSKTSNVAVPEMVVVTTIDNLLAENHTTAWQDTATEPMTARVSKILKTVDKFGMHVLENVKQNESIRFSSTKNIVLTVANIPADQDVNFPENKGILRSSLNLPPQLRHSTESIYYLAVKYKTIGGILNDKTRQKGSLKETVGSDILSLTLKNFLPKGTLRPPLKLTFSKENPGPSIIQCVFWDFNHNNGTGGWSTAGCKTEATHDLYTQCTCNHLTNFAILLRPYSKVDDEEEALSWISLIGCSISVFLSIITALVYIVFWKSVTSETSRVIDKITVFLCLSIAMAYALFLAGVDKTQYKVGCTVIAALLQCLFLLIFFLMLAMGWYYFASLSLLKISFSKASKLKSRANLMSKITWGIVTLMPIFITAVTFGSVYSSGKSYHSETSCWLSFESGALYGFIAPVALIVLVNIVIVISLSVTLCSSTIVSKGAKKRASAGIKSISILLPVLGVTWVFGLLSINDDTIVLQYIFSILNSFQGLFIFTAKCILNKKVRKAFMKTISNKEIESSRSKPHKSHSNTTHVTNVDKSRIQFRGVEAEHNTINKDLIMGISFKPIESSAI
ncbi:adhesion G protein-coupled receptor L3-like isoform X2 [Ostrea edulis]|uniref:adhesion G protein-coupled receptor L3-like isoform X2 n=1 Tax=Ostrea edulis TaxID=37623 RepID=UPI0024AF67F5|nr:adhesion G protein-coupled receptor L3-like isoform X2 [Ostrea edulis]